MRGPYELWLEADGDRDRYLELLSEQGHLVDRCPAVSERSGRRCNLAAGHVSGLHDFRNLVDIFGHEREEVGGRP